ncbi:hypothetical protein B0H14DRAFT_3503942 [Mycena olivaceomarginata]|nr:hypothetical protein B0H14DRAFT_3503942 [Mycena olivaceomarginata]
MSPSFSCGRLSYFSSLCATFPLTFRRHNRLVPLRISKSADQHLPPETQGGFFLHSSLPLPLFPLPSLPPAFLPQVRVCGNDAFVAQAAGPEDRARIVDAICADGGEIPMHRLGSAMTPFSGVSKPPRAPRSAVRSSPACGMSSAPPFLFPNSKALDCEEEVCLLIVSELLWAAPATTLITELSWTRSLHSTVNKSLKDQWAALAYQETGSPVTQAPRPRETRGERQDGIIDELFAHGAAVFCEVANSQWGSYCIQHSTLLHLLYHGPILITHRYDRPRTRVGEAPQNAARAPLTALLMFVTNEQVSKSVVKALKEGGKETLDRVVQPAKGARRAIIVDLALAHKERADRLRPPSCQEGSTGSKVIWLLYAHPIQFILNPLSSVFFSNDRMRAYYGY